MLKLRIDVTSHEFPKTSLSRVLAQRKSQTLTCLWGERGFSDGDLEVLPVRTVTELECIEYISLECVIPRDWLSGFAGMKNLTFLTLFVDLEDFGYDEESDNKMESVTAVYKAYMNRRHKTLVVVNEWDRNERTGRKITSNLPIASYFKIVRVDISP